MLLFFSSRLGGLGSLLLSAAVTIGPLLARRLRYSKNATSAMTGRWSENALALRSVQAERIVKSREA